MQDTDSISQQDLIQCETLCPHRTGSSLAANLPELASQHAPSKCRYGAIRLSAQLYPSRQSNQGQWRQYVPPHAQFSSTKHACSLKPQLSTYSNPSPLILGSAGMSLTSRAHSHGFGPLRPACKCAPLPQSAPLISFIPSHQLTPPLQPLNPISSSCIASFAWLFNVAHPPHT